MTTEAWGQSFLTSEQLIRVSSMICSKLRLKLLLACTPETTIQVRTRLA